MKTIKIITVLAIVLVSVVQIQAIETSFTWNASPSSDIDYYNLYCGSAPDTYNAPVNVGNVTAYSGDYTGDLYCRLTAVNTYGNESVMSEECSNVRPSAPSGFRCSQ